MDWKGRPRKVMLWANRNGFAYVLDRTTGEFLLGTAFVKQNWNLGFDNGRPVRDPKAKPTPEGTRIEPGTQGGTNWYSPSFSPRTGLFYVSAWDNYSAVARYADVAPWEEGKKYTGRAPAGPGGGAGGRAPVAYRTEEEGYGAVRAIDPKTGDKKWDFKMVDSPKAVSSRPLRISCSAAAAKDISLRSTRAPASYCGRPTSVAPLRMDLSPLPPTAGNTWRSQLRARSTCSGCVTNAR